MLPPQRNEIPPPKKLPILVLNFNFHNCASTSSRYSPGFFPGYLFFFKLCFSFLFFPGCKVLIYRHHHISLRHKAVEIHLGILDILGACRWDRVGVVSSCTMGLFCGCYRFIYWLLGWFSNRTGALVDDGARKSNNFSPFRLLSRRQLLHRKLDPNWFSETVPRCNSTQHRTVFTRLRLNIIHFSGLKIFRKF